MSTNGATKRVGVKAARLNWACPDQSTKGVAFGYTVFKRELRKALADCGTTFDDNAETALHVCTPLAWSPVDGQSNVVFTMWESEDLDQRRINSLARADALITCSHFCASIFKEHLPGMPIGVVPLGIQPLFHTYRVRQTVKPFIWLWVGAPNARKGWDILGEVWNKRFLNKRNVHLYIKTTGTSRDGTVHCQNNVTVDYRTMTDRELLDLYHMAHAFAFPTGGEGFGLTLAEAMATGLPCITTRYSGVMDFTDRKNVYYVDHMMTPTDMSDGGSGRSALVDADSLIATMEEVMGDYSKATRKGRRAHRSIAPYTWENSASRLLQCLRTMGFGLSVA